MITYGNGEVIGLENIQGFDIRFKGSITIDPAQDNWIIQANKNRIIGICLNQTSSALLFTYTGELRILSAKYIRNNEQHRSRITLQGVDFWGLDREKWEDDGSLWGTRNGTYLVGTKKRKTTVKNLENGVSKVPVIDVGSKGFDAPYVPPPPPPLVNTYSLNFDGSDDYVDIGDSDDLMVGTNVTISTWFKNSSGTRAYMFQSRRGSTSTNLSVGVNMNASGVEEAGWIGIVIYTGSGHSYASVDGNVDDGAWHHFAATVSDGSQKLYLDGSEVASASNAFPNDASADHSIIGSNSGNNRFMNGNIDEVALWNTVLDADAVTAIYNSGTPTNLSSDSGDYDNSANLQGYWRMGDGTLDTYPLIADQTNATLGSNLQDATFNNSDLLGFTGATATGFTAVNADSGVGANDNAYGKALSLTAGDIYKLSWTTTINSYDLVQQLDVAVATSVGGGSGDTTTAGTHTASGDYVNYFQVASTNTYYIAFRLGGNREYDFTISNVSLQKVNGNAGLMNNMVSGDIEEDTP